MNYDSVSVEDRREAFDRMGWTSVLFCGGLYDERNRDRTPRQE